jgi:hypothetical protein
MPVDQQVPARVAERLKLMDDTGDSLKDIVAVVRRAHRHTCRTGVDLPAAKTQATRSRAGSTGEPPRLDPARSLVIPNG